MDFFKKKNESKEKNIKEKKTKEKKILEKELNSKKVNKLTKFDYLRVLRVIVWTIITILIIRGAVSVIKPNNLEVIMDENKKFLSEIEAQNSLELKLFSFAEEFTRDYFTRYPKNKDDFKNRMMKYTTEQLAIDMNNSSYSEVINASAFYFEKYSENQFNVSVKAKIKQFVPKAGQENISEDKKVYENAISIEYIRIPIYVDKNGNMLVEDIPVMTAAPEKAHVDSTVYSGMEESNSEINKKISDSLNEFFKAYYGGEQTQLNFLLESEGIINVSPGESKFEKINNIKVYKLNDKDHLAVVDLMIKSFGNEFKQRLNVTITNDGDKYLVKKLDTRTSNLNIK